MDASCSRSPIRPQSPAKSTQTHQSDLIWETVAILPLNPNKQELLLRLMPHRQPCRDWVPPMNRLLILLLTLVVAPATLNCCCGQDWRDPALQQPLPQYYPANRYPLDDSEVLEKITPMAKPTPDNPVMNSPSFDSRNPPSESILDTGSNLTNQPRQIFVTEKPVAKRLPKNKTETPDPKKKSPVKSKEKTAKKSHPFISYDIYRDGSRFPIDPRKPCSVCRRPVGKCNCGVDHGQCGPGNHGQPYQDREPGGYACGKNCPSKRPMFSVYWPRPFSAKHAEGHPHRCNCDQCATRINDRFDHLIKFKLIDYQRTDNGHCGPGADPYGCLGESKYQALGFGM